MGNFRSFTQFCILYGICLLAIVFLRALMTLANNVNHPTQFILSLKQTKSSISPSSSIIIVIIIIVDI